MKVDIVKQKFQSGVNSYNSSAQKQNSPHFTGMSITEKRMMNLLHHKRAIEIMKSFEWLKGEIGGILLTALGTGAVAPIFIGFNPFVHAPKDATPEEKQEVINTKEYTAMRQPVSAGLAILFQAGVQKWIDKGLDAIFNHEELSKYAYPLIDQHVINTDTYIKAGVKKELKEAGKTKPSLIASWFSSEAKRKRNEYIEEFDAKVDAIKDSQVGKIAADLEKDHIIHIGKRDLDFKTTAELVNKQIDDYIKDIDALKKNDDKIANFKQRAGVLIDNEEHLKDIFKDIPTQQIKEKMSDYIKIIKAESVDETQKANCKKELNDLYKEVGDKIQRLLEKETNPDVKMLLQEILERPEDLRANRIDRTFQRIESIKKMCKPYGGFSIENYGKALLERNSVLATKRLELTEAKVAEPPNATKDVIEKAIAKIKAACKFQEGDSVLEPILQNTSTFDSNSERIDKKIYKDIAKAYKKMVEKHYKGWNQITKVFVGVCITLPITCYALNWVYPRFMEIFFPKLAGVKKDKSPVQAQQQGGDK